VFADMKKQQETNAGNYNIKLCNMSYGQYIVEQFHLEYTASVSLI